MFIYVKITGFNGPGIKNQRSKLLIEVAKQETALEKPISHKNPRLATLLSHFWMKVSLIDTQARITKHLEIHHHGKNTPHIT